jgi:type IV pilus assembly protein PilB
MEENMIKEAAPLILCIDDNIISLNLLEHILLKNGFRVAKLQSSKDAVEKVIEINPDLILLDVMIPEMDGYEVCSILSKKKEASDIPVIFVTALEAEQDKIKAFSSGGVDFIAKPVQKDILLDKIKYHLLNKKCWENIRSHISKIGIGIIPSTFIEFKKYLLQKLKSIPDIEQKINGINFMNIYSSIEKTKISSKELAKMIAGFLNISYINLINPEEILIGILPAPYCKENLVIPVNDDTEKMAFVLSNPFSLELNDVLKRVSGKQNPKILITEPQNLDYLLGLNPAMSINLIKKEDDIEEYDDIDLSMKIDEEVSEEEIQERPVVYLTNKIIQSAVDERASDIHIEPKEKETVVRFRVDGDMKGAYVFKNETGSRIISRLKVLGNLNIAERRKPQDGSFLARVFKKILNIRLATTSSIYGESLIIRLLEPKAAPKKLTGLGMTEDQQKTMIELANCNEGLILIVGPTGSGKTTTIYSLLSKINCEKKSLISLEDPVEYRIQYANQQQVNEKAGVTFESLLKSSVRQDPDILYIGEIRDPFSAKIAVDFASTGHITITTMHTNSATSAIFRLERQEVTRDIIAESVIAIIAQRLVKKLCNHCKEIKEISSEMREKLSHFSAEVPDKVAYTKGCFRCNQTGYFGREAIYEVIKFDPEIKDMVRNNVPIAEIRGFLKQRGDLLIGRHGIEKIKNLIFDPRDVYGKILVDEEKLNITKRTDNRKIPETIPVKDNPYSFLVVEDDQISQKIIKKILINAGYQVECVGDGIEALMCLGKGKYDLIISDINMPNMDGFKLLEIMKQKNINTPVILLTGDKCEESEIKGLELGAVEYFIKPIKKELLLAKINNLFQNRTIQI